MKDFEEIILKIPLSGLTREEAKLAFNYILEGKAEDHQIEKFLLGLKERGETIEEISAGADVMIEKALYVKAPNNAIDTCGTGGDSLGSYNISTAASLVAAGAGAFIAKHGNRALSSKSGSSDHRSHPITLKRGSRVSASIRTRSMAPGAARWPPEICAPSKAGPVLTALW